MRSRPVTELDVARGQVRFPPEAGRALPAERAQVAVEFRGRRLYDVGWDPCAEVDREASALLCPGVDALRDLVRPGTELELTVRADGMVVLE